MRTPLLAIVTVALCSLAACSSGTGGTGGGSGGGTGGTGGSGGGSAGGSGGGVGGGTGGGSGGGSGGGGAVSASDGGGTVEYDITDGGFMVPGHYTGYELSKPTLSGGQLGLSFGDSNGSNPNAFQSRAIQLALIVDAGVPLACGVNVRIVFAENWVSFSADAGTSRQMAFDSVSAGSRCTVNLTQADQVDGGAIRGSFEAYLVGGPDGGVLLRNGTFESKFR